jgi:hypothetical protein
MTGRLWTSPQMIKKKKIKGKMSALFMVTGFECKISNKIIAGNDFRLACLEV